MATRTADATSWPSKWEFVHPGTQLLINGYAWVCTSRTGRTVVMDCPKLAVTKPGTPNSDKPVTIIGRGHPLYMDDPADKAQSLLTATMTVDRQYDLAVAMVQIRLEGRLIATKETKDQPYTVLPLATDTPQHLREHLMQFHDVFGEDTADDDLLALHDASHGRTQPVPHVHKLRS